MDRRVLALPSLQLRRQLLERRLEVGAPRRQPPDLLRHRGTPGVVALPRVRRIVPAPSSYVFFQTTHIADAVHAARATGLLVLPLLALPRLALLLPPLTAAALVAFSSVAFPPGTLRRSVTPATPATGSRRAPFPGRCSRPGLEAPCARRQLRGTHIRPNAGPGPVVLSRAFAASAARPTGVVAFSAAIPAPPDFQVPRRRIRPRLTMWPLLPPAARLVVLPPALLRPGLITPPAPVEVIIIPSRHGVIIGVA